MTYHYYRNEASNPSHLPHLECPRCKHHAVVSQGENRYVCLHCGWSKSVGDWELPGWLILFFMGIVFILLVG